MIKRLLARVLYIVYRVIDPIARFHDVSILTYHSISDTPIDTAISRERFEAHLTHLLAKGHSFVSLHDVVLWYTGKKELPRKSVAITFDDGYLDFETIALPILARQQAPATVFVMQSEVLSRPRLNNNLPLLSHDALQALKRNSRVEIGFHGKTHADMRHLKGMPLRDELERPAGARYFAFAGGSYTHEAIRVLEEFGYEAAFSIKPGLITKKSHRFLLQRNVITRDLSLHDVEFRATRAIEWYARITRWVK